MIRAKHQVSIAFFTLALCVAGQTQAEIVNVLPDAVEDNDGVSGSFAVPLEWRTGATELIQVGADLSVIFQSGTHTVLLLANGEYGFQGGDRFLSNHFQHLRFREQFTDRVAGETFVQHGYDEFQRLRTRLLFGIGPRFTVAEWDDGELIFGTAYMPEYEVIDEGNEEDAGDELFAHRWSNYMQVAINIEESLTFSETVFAQPVFTNFEDIRVLSETALRVSAGDFFIQNSFIAAYDSRSPDSVPDLNTTLESSLGVSW